MVALTLELGGFRTQSLDLVPFAALENALCNIANDSVKLDDTKMLDVLNFCALLKSANNTAITEDNIKVGFTRARIWPFCPSKVIGVECPRSGQAGGATVAVDKLQ